MKEYEISEAINKDYQKVITSAQMSEFKKNLKYKSEVSRKTDEQLVSMILTRLEMYKNGWVMANSAKTVNLASAADEIQEAWKLIDHFNNTLNNLIKLLRPNIPENILKELRGLERELQEIRK